MGILAEVSGDENNGEHSRTFVFHGEGHTLGNALTTIILRYPEVVFCGYTIPHPTDNKLHLRIQASSGRAIDFLRRGLEDLSNMCDFTLSCFESELKEYSNKDK